ncbi:MAG: bifunctional (p)ppGpp synthetase/guanosine-3',5'-bis(diphosphate) 3'-pyrophosphohydrolase [Actinomycetota bacterium]|nr:bifunctional (p)ppGpp synthetase/guanosine-3',5'-bis(diphosphate) 3'-pyrophosphohydrolase [Actinomycetota bacterium]
MPATARARANRTLPWRREQREVGEEIGPMVARFKGPNSDQQVDLVARAYQKAKVAHQRQRRKSGEPYIVHPVAVATIVAAIGLDEFTVAAALLHDAVEDTGCTLEEVEAEFGHEVAVLVDGVTKLDRLRFDSKEAQQAATFRKMLVAMSKDLRVLIIKLADRLHNLRTIGALPAWKQERTARETLDVYAPLAHRLGMQDIKSQLEDLSFAALHPKRYATIENMVAVRAPERDIYLTQVLEDVRHPLAELHIEANVTGREKHLYSIYEKMVVKGREFDEINDLIGIRVIVDSVRDCYAALGSIHATWKPVQGRFKDYVAMPKFNLYQSLHTTVIGPQGKPIEVQIRTLEMHDRSEFGVASHFRYKDRAKGTENRNGRDGRDAAGVNDDLDLPWLSRIIDWEKETSDHHEFMESLKIDLDQEEVFVFTPKGDVMTMPVGSTPVDFAYSIHTDVGHRTIGAKVDGKLVALSQKLNSGETVQIFTSGLEGAGPSKDWLQFVGTPRAAGKIKQWFSRERREDAIVTGREDIDTALRREGLPVRKIASSQTLARIAEQLSYPDLESLYADVGEHRVSARSIAARVARELTEGTREEPQPATLPITARRPENTSRGQVGVHVEGLDGVLIRLSRCCTPVPGDPIVGFVTRGRGVSVHRADCANAVSLSASQNDRLIEVDWDNDAESAKFVASVEVKAYDRARLLSDVAMLFSGHHVNIISATTLTGSDRIARLKFDFEIADPSHLESLLREVRRIDGVYDVYRAMPGRS